MILDAFLLFSNAQSFAGVLAGTTVSTNVIDFGLNSGIPSFAAGGGARDMGASGDRPRIYAQVTTAFTNGTSLQVALQGAIDDGTGAPSTFNTWWTSPVYALATLNIGSRLFDMDMPRPPDGLAIPRFVRMAYITIGTMNAGVITAGLVLDRMDQAYQSTDNAVLGGYAAGITVAN